MFIGFRRFREMEYVLEVLMQSEQFELAVSVCCCACMLATRLTRCRNSR